MSDNGTWKNTKVRHHDGRTGVIYEDFEGFGYRYLSIAVDGVDKDSDDANDHIQLNSDCKDSGSAGWEWLCENFAGGAKWLTLGDHNK